VEIPKRCSTLILILFEIHFTNNFTIPVNHVTTPRLHNQCFELLSEAPRDEHARAVRQTVNSRAGFGNAGRAFEDVNGVAGEEEGYGGSEAGEAGADYEDLGV
jgi:hypothetical protein